MLLKYLKFLAIIIPIVFLISSCSVGINSAITKHYPPLKTTEKIAVIELNDSTPANAEILGTIRIYDDAFTTNCSYDVVLEAAKTEARKAGGDAIKITEHKFPSIWSSCHQINADILKLDAIQTSADSSRQEIPSRYVKMKEKPVIDNSSYKAFYLSGEYGVSWRTAKIDPSLNGFEKDYLRNLLSGSHYGFSGIYYLSRGIGVGLMYDKHFSSNSVNVMVQDSVTGQYISAELKDDISINMVCALVDFRAFSMSGKNSVHFRIDLGYCGYKDEGGFIVYGTIKGSTFTMAYDLSYDIYIVDQWYFSPGLSYKIASLSSYDVTLNNQTQHVKLESGHSESLTRVDLSAALRFKW